MDVLLWIIVFSVLFAHLLGAKDYNDHSYGAIGITIGTFLGILFCYLAGVKDGELQIPLVCGLGYIGFRCGMKVSADYKSNLEKIKNSEQKRNQAKKPVYQNSYADFADDGAAGDFGFDAGRFGAKPPPPQPDENAPRGYDKRHPDDAKLWAFVDDPETPEEEALSALRKIHQRERQRKQGKKPSDVKGFLSGR